MSDHPSHPIRADIQGLRALAIAMVLLFHAGFPVLEGGYVGVDVFFVISGYLITRMLVTEKEKYGRLDLLAFYARRIRRLLPAASVTLAGTALTVYALFSPLEQSQLIRSLFSSVVYLSNMWFAFQATDYLGEAVDLNPYLHTWSLSVEEQFYLVWPLLIVLLPFHSSARDNIFRLIVLVGSVCGLSLLGELIMGEISQPWAFFAAPFRAWEFATGSLAFCFDRQNKFLSPSINKLGVSMGVSAILLAGFFFDKSTPFPGLYALLPTLGTFLVLIGGQQQNWFMEISKFPGIRWLGDISYSLYLWHWPLIAIPLSLTGNLSAFDRVTCITIALILGSLSYQFIENPIRFNSHLARSPLKGLAVGVGLTILGISLTFTLRALAKVELQSPAQQNILAANTLHSKISLDGCHLDFMKVDIPDCSYGETHSTQTLFLFGDSHAAQWFPILEKFSLQHGFRLVSLTKSACPSAHLTPYNQAFGRPYSECGAWQTRVLQRITQERPILVILGNSSAHIGSRSNQVSPLEWINGMRDTLNIIQRTGAQIAIIRDNPRFPYDISICLSRAEWTGTPASSCDASIAKVLDESMFHADLEAAKNVPQVHILDFSGILCGEMTCTAMINDHIGYKDSHHLALQTVQDLESTMERELIHLFPQQKFASSPPTSSMVVSETE